MNTFRLPLGTLFVAVFAVAVFSVAPFAHAQFFGDDFGDDVIDPCCDLGSYSSGVDYSYPADYGSYSTGADYSYTPDYGSYSTGADYSYTPDYGSSSLGADYFSTPDYESDYLTSGYMTSSYLAGSSGFSAPLLATSIPFGGFGGSSNVNAPTIVNTNTNVNTNTCSANNSCNTNIVTTTNNPAPVVINNQPPVVYPQPPVVYNQPPAYVPPPVVPTYPATPYITLSQVPYTGLDLGFWGTIAYWGFFILWCLAAAYLIVVKKVQNRIYRAMKNFLFGTTTTPEEAKEIAAAESLDLQALASQIAALITPQVATSNGASARTNFEDKTDDFVLSQINRPLR